MEAGWWTLQAGGPIGPEAREQGTTPTLLVRMHRVRGQRQKLCSGVIPNGERHVRKDSPFLVITLSLRAKAGSWSGIKGVRGRVYKSTCTNSEDKWKTLYGVFPPVTQMSVEIVCLLRFSEITFKLIPLVVRCLSCNLSGGYGGGKFFLVPSGELSSHLHRMTRVYESLWNLSSAAHIPHHTTADTSWFFPECCSDELFVWVAHLTEDVGFILAFSWMQFIVFASSLPANIQFPSLY